MTHTQLLAALSGAVLAAGVVLLTRQLIPGMHVTPDAPPWLRPAARRIWNGPGRSHQRRRYRITTAAAAAAGSAAWLISDLPVLGLAAAAAMPGVPWLLAGGRAEKRAIARVEAIGEWTRRLRDVAGTGAGLQSAIQSAAATAPPAIDEQARRLAARLQAGENARQALLAFADQIDDPTCDQIIAALLLHLRDRGDRLGTVLTAIADAATREVAARKEADAERAGARFSIRFMVGFTILVGTAAAVAGDYMSPYATATGQLVMVMLAAGFIAVLLWVRALTSPVSVPRMFGPAAQGVRR